MTKWKTAISVHKNNELYLRGEKLTKLAGTFSFTEAVYFLWQEKRPSKRQEKMLNVLLVASIEHGVEAPSSFVARTVASTGNQMNAALAAGVLAIGDWHGGAIEEAAKLLQSKRNPREIVATALARRERIPGYGHKLYKDKDPRAEVIFKNAKKLGFYRNYAKRAEAISTELKKQSGKRLALNIDGAIAAIISELGFDWRIGKAFFSFGRFPGLIAHVLEEMVNEKSYRRLKEEDVEYIGPAPKG